MSTLDNNSDNFAQFMADVRIGARDLMMGTDKVDAGRGLITSSLILAASVNSEYRAILINRSLSLVTKRTDENKSEVDAARLFFRDLLVKEDSDAATRLTQKDEPDRASRDRHNNKAQALDQSATFAAYCLIAIDHAKVWQSISPPKNKANRGSINVSLDGISVLFPDKQKSLETMEATFVTISNRAGAWRMSQLETIGKLVVQSKGLRDAPKVKATPVKDAALAFQNSVENNDTKSVNTNIEARLALFAAMIAGVNQLNDKTFAQPMPNELATPLLAYLSNAMSASEKERDDKIKSYVAKAA